MVDQTPGRRRRTSPRPPPASPLDVDDLLQEILLHVPPRPFSLPRASLVCKRWRRLVSDPWFLRRFCAHHGKAPLLGLFEQRFGEKDIVFSPIHEPPDRIPPRRFFPLGRAVAGADREIEVIQLLDCRHGRLTFVDMSRQGFTLFVCDPITGGHARLAVPPEFRSLAINGAVLCAASEQGHVHGACHSDPFKIVLVSIFSSGNDRPMACVYSSETGMWGNIIWHDPLNFLQFMDSSTLLIGHTLYCLFSFVSEDEEDVEFEFEAYMPERDGILEFDLDRQSLTVTKGLPVNNGIHRRIIKTVDGGVGLVTLSYPTLQMWHKDRLSSCCYMGAL